ncbi:MAG: AAA family ATPase [Desulfuromonadales bacterium]|nr:AAA family ATPase [Desulfuromonadales bacterium]
MYLHFYGFAEKPFNITPNPRFIFLSKTHREVFAHLLYGLRQQCGFIELTGEVGTGKTTVLRTLMADLEKESYRLAYIFNPSLEPIELLQCIHREFSLAAPAQAGAADLVAILNQFLLAENAAGRTVVLVIDEAQNLTPTVLEQIRLLSNLETEAAKLIQIVLVGQPELEAVLRRPDLRQLNQRITVRYRLQPLDFVDTEAYIRHRLKVAGGGAEKVSFSPAAIRAIFRHTRGLPRLVNILCDRALLIGYIEEAREITAHHVRTASGELQREENRPRRWRFAFGWGVSALALLGVLWLLLPLQVSRTVVEPIAAASLAVPYESLKVPSPRLTALHQDLRRLNEGESAALAFNALARLWQVRPIRAGGRLQIPEEMQQVVDSRGLQLTAFEGTLPSLQALDSPALLEIPVPGLDGKRYLAVTRIAGGRAFIAPPLGGSDSVALEELDQLWFGRGYFLWRNYLGLPNLLLPGAAGEAPTQLQELLRQVGLYQGPPSGVFDADTVRAISRFQASRGIVADGRAGPQTLLLLYQADRRFVVPRMSATGEKT